MSGTTLSVVIGQADVLITWEFKSPNCVQGFGTIERLFAVTWMFAFWATPPVLTMSETSFYLLPRSLIVSAAIHLDTFVQNVQKLFQATLSLAFPPALFVWHFYEWLLCNLAWFWHIAAKKAALASKPPLNTHWAASDIAQNPFEFSGNKQYVIVSAKVYRNLGHLVSHKKAGSSLRTCCIASQAKVHDHNLPSRQEMWFKMIRSWSSCSLVAVVFHFNLLLCIYRSQSKVCMFLHTITKFVERKILLRLRTCGCLLCVSTICIQHPVLNLLFFLHSPTFIARLICFGILPSTSLFSRVIWAVT